jgi:hypothetical protein
MAQGGEAALRGRRQLDDGLMEFVNPKRCGYFHNEGDWTTDCIDIDWCNVRLQYIMLSDPQTAETHCLWRLVLAVREG